MIEQTFYEESLFEGKNPPVEIKYLPRKRKRLSIDFFSSS